MSRKYIEVDAYSKKTLGIKDRNDDWYNFDGSNASRNEEEVRNDIGRIDKGDSVYLTISSDGKYTDFQIDKKGFSKGGDLDSGSGGMSKSVRIRRQSALKSAVEFCKVSDGVSKEDVLALATQFNNWLKNGGGSQ